MTTRTNNYSEFEWTDLLDHLLYLVRVTFDLNFLNSYKSNFTFQIAVKNIDMKLLWIFIQQKL